MNSLEAEIGSDGGTESAPAARRSAERQPLVDGELNDFCVAFEPKLLHDTVFVKGDGAGRDMQDVGGFLHRISFCQQLQNFTLAGRQFTTVRTIPSLDERLDHAL